MKKKNPKRIAALLCVFLLISMYIVTFIAACLDTTNSGQFFAACLTATIILPVLLWIIFWFYDLWKKRQEEAISSMPDADASSEAKHTD